MAATRSENKVLGTQVEESIADRRDGERTPEAWFDVEASDGTVVEVKSTQRRVTVNWDGQGKTRPGRYQIEESNHRNLLDHGGEYEFVLRDRDDNEIETVTMTADEVQQLIEDEDRTWPSGSKLKLPYKSVHGEVA